MKAILAVNKINFIGKDGEIMWDCPQDLAYFKKMTLGCRLLCGHNTYLKLPKLPGRSIMVDFRGDRLVKFASTKYDWCIGGKRTYEKYCHLFTELHISYINNDDEGDVMLPNLKDLNPDCKIITHYFGF